MEIRPLDTSNPDEIAAAGQVVQDGYFALAGYPRDDEYDMVIGSVGERAQDTTVLVAVEDGTVLGCLTYVAHDDNEHAEHDDPGAASFRYFGVSPKAQGKGVGDAMVRWVVDQARTDGKQRIRIHTLTMMHRAMRLYERHGFVRDPDHDEDWDGIVGLGYVKHLD